MFYVEVTYPQIVNNFTSEFWCDWLQKRFSGNPFPLPIPEGRSFCEMAEFKDLQPARNAYKVSVDMLSRWRDCKDAIGKDFTVKLLDISSSQIIEMHQGKVGEGRESPPPLQSEIG